MKIVMATNTYLPHVGGVANSVKTFTEEYRKRGHEVLVVCPEFPGRKINETGVIRVPAIQNFNGTDFSVALPLPGLLLEAMNEFRPDIVHSHHPFLLGDTALRISAHFNIPLVFTHHTMYEQYTHYVPADSPEMQKFAIELSTGYGNLCNVVIAPSESIKEILGERAVEAPIEVVPTGVDLEKFAHGDGASFRRHMHIPPDAFVVGHVGRLAPEKNLDFLVRAVCEFLKKNQEAYLLIVGDGPSVPEIKRLTKKAGVARRVRLAGSRKGRELVSAYRAMSIFAFASKSETQGMVIMEALAAGLPVVALDATGVRDVLRDGAHGVLLRDESEAAFADALNRMAELSVEQREAMLQSIRNDVQACSSSACAGKALAIYESLVGAPRRFVEAERSAWWMALRRIEAEWEIWSNVASSLAKAVMGDKLTRYELYKKLSAKLRRMGRKLRRREWAIKLLGLRTAEAGDSEPGLIMIQIDGLSRAQLERAMKRRRRLPFLRFLLSREDYKLKTFYSGVPSTTPAVQAELFYGEKQAVPAFEFFDRASKSTFRMFSSRCASEIERGFQAGHRGLLENGSCYSNIYTGGARNAHYCASAMGWGDVLRVNPLRKLILLVAHAWNILRILGLLIVELFLAVADSIRGIWKGRDLYMELRFIPYRVIVSAFLREAITIGACMDAERGVPVIHLNYLGYDEQAHRRGPSSAFAYWTLKGIDGCIKRIWKAAHSSSAREYQIWIYSDHGQEACVPYSLETGQSLRSAIEKIFGRKLQGDEDGGGMQLKRAAFARRKPFPSLSYHEQTIAEIDPAKIAVAAMGPLGFLYLPEELPPAVLDEYCERLVREAQIPLVLRRDGQDRAVAWNSAGRHNLPEDAEAVLGAGHPFLHEAARDLGALCSHRFSGEIVISGWRARGVPISFPIEHGAHGGPGAEETRGFVLLPPAVPVMEEASDHLRPLQLRELALEAMGRSHVAGAIITPSFKRKPGTTRIMTYNVHSCLGLDGRLSIARIAKVIAYYDPDIICLQELDVGRRRTGHLHQAEELAHVLEMAYQFNPALEVKGELYGDAILSRFPMRLFKAGPLPTVDVGRYLEPRGALWVEVEIGGRKVHIMNTHLGLNRLERYLQASCLVGQEWLEHPHCDGPVILCGDMNAGPGSRVYRALSAKLKDAHRLASKRRPKNTWQSQFPMRRIDYVFVSKDVRVVAACVPTNALTRATSDHLPLFLDLEMP